jgi:hypothetical protein
MRQHAVPDRFPYGAQEKSVQQPPEPSPEDQHATLKSPLKAELNDFLTEFSHLGLWPESVGWIDDGGRATESLVLWFWRREGMEAELLMALIRERERERERERDLKRLNGYF